MLLRKLNRIKPSNQNNYPNKVFETINKLIQSDCYINKSPKWLAAIKNNKPTTSYIRNKLNPKFNKPLYNNQLTKDYENECFYYEPYKAKHSKLLLRLADNPRIIKTIDPKTKKPTKTKKKSLNAKPYEIRYDLEDGLRQRFFRDHPFELMRPVCLVDCLSSSKEQEDIIDKIGVDYSFVPSSEDIIKYIIKLHKQDNIDIDKAYEIGCGKLIQHRKHEEKAISELLNKNNSKLDSLNKEILNSGLRLEIKNVDTSKRTIQEKMMMTKATMMQMEKNYLKTQEGNTNSSKYSDQQEEAVEN